MENKDTFATENSIHAQLDENKTDLTNERRKSTKASIVCTSLAFALAVVFAAIMILFAINLSHSSGTEEAVGGLFSFVILLVYAGSAIALVCVGLCVASIVTSSVAIKSTNPKNKKIATATLISSIMLMLATIACVIYIVLNGLG